MEAALREFRDLYRSSGARDPLLEGFESFGDKRFYRVTIGFNITEVSNLADELRGPVRGRFFDQLRELRAGFVENYRPSSDLASSALAHVYGITDIGTIEAARSHYVVLTEDSLLASCLRGNGILCFDLLLIGNY